MIQEIKNFYEVMPAWPLSSSRTSSLAQRNPCSDSSSSWSLHFPRPWQSLMSIFSLSICTFWIFYINESCDLCFFLWQDSFPWQFHTCIQCILSIFTPSRPLLSPFFSYVLPPSSLVILTGYVNKKLYISLIDNKNVTCCLGWVKFPFN